MTDSSFALLAFRSMTESDVQGGTVTFGDKTYPCTVGLFSVRDMLVNGGITPMMIGDVQIALEDVPEAKRIFPVGLKVTVTPKTGKVRFCTLFTTDYSGPFVVLNLHDANEKA